MQEEEHTQTVTFFYHPHELSLKGKNRAHFEDVLSQNIRQLLKAAGVQNIKIEKITGRHFVTVPIEYEMQLAEVSPRIFGIANYGHCISCSRDVEVLKSKVIENVKEILDKHPINSFRVETSRVDKRYPLTSQDVSKEIGTVVHEGLNIPVNLTQPELTIKIEILNDKFVFYTERLPGAKGLPIHTSGHVACLLSGGFDSPVASWLMMRRGCSVTYIHFHSSPYGEWRSSVSKIRKIVQQLSLYGGPTKFYSVAIGESQRIIATKAPAKLRITLYRRLMMRIAKEIAEKHKCLALATGDSLGQVASQTIESMTTIQSVIQPMLIMRPLLGFCKEEIMERAKEIGTYDISILPGGDCCSHMLPKNVATKPSMNNAEEGEKNLDLKAMVESAINGAQIIDINEPWNEDENETGAACPFTFQE
ncbi:tRNA 4-thiouridine(8) synthase ThiI [Histomonas meleagridis]|uniref:tRNA 4-thiouridine(8) synthase ThiI n=1 Tax=Histomonas meleagridis TaxID=135588 RepID=UPI003559EA92|nr:tRNA 4-thiouridine(8) synthase ThiI [Histomonas meleagridis]KAH0798622.1 tRNA 4-thiouridine(8) synthase ThiI [Histomonas meleagridis]